MGVDGKYGCDWARTGRPHRRGGLNHHKGHEIVAGGRGPAAGRILKHFILSFPLRIARVDGRSIRCRILRYSATPVMAMWNVLICIVSLHVYFRFCCEPCTSIILISKQIHFEFSLIESRCSGTPSITPHTIDWHGISLLAADLQPFCETPVSETVSHAWNHVSNFWI